MVLAFADPAQEDVAGGLHQALAGDDAVAVVAQPAATRKRLQNGSLRFLDLQEQGILGVSRIQEQNKAARADAANSHYLAGKIHETVPFQQGAAILLQ